ncbi:hypothetical protein [Anaerostipes faecalis]|uniref:hypothetical protein n=1 Tax=Anaerostipes faecalis TaxID=2738446 RepID=UPI001C1E8914|nr:hypothetical protein [Anaerostipes faecalis]
MAVIPFAACIWFFTSDSIVYRPMMLQSICVVYIWMTLLFDRWFKEKWANIAGLLLTVIIFNYGIQANISYYHLNRCYESSYATGLEMIERIHQLSNGKINHIAVTGNIAKEVCLGGEKKGTGLQLLGQLIEDNLLFDQEHTVLFLSNTFKLDLSAVSQKQLKKLEESNKVKEMECWPKANSIRVIDNTIVIKLSNNSSVYE